MLTGTPGAMSVVDMDFSGKRARISGTPGMRPFKSKSGTAKKKCVQQSGFYQAIRGQFEAINPLFTKSPAQIVATVSKVWIHISLLFWISLSVLGRQPAIRKIVSPRFGDCAKGMDTRLTFASNSPQMS